MGSSKFEKFLDENNELRVAAERFADDFLGKNVCEDARENVIMIFVFGAVWQANEYVKRLSKKRNGK